MLTKITDRFLQLKLWVVIICKLAHWSSTEAASQPAGDFRFDCLSQNPVSTDTYTHDLSTSPAFITVSSTTFYPGQEISVYLISRYPIRSYIIQARSETEDGVDSGAAGGPHGWWPQDPNSFRCLSAADTVYYNTNTASYVKKVHAVWTTSKANLPAVIYFRASIVAADNQIWTNIKSFNLKQITQSDVSTQTTKKHVATKSSVTKEPITASVQPPVLYRIRQSILEEKINEFQHQNQKLLRDDDYGNEGDWTRLREKVRVDHIHYMRHQLVSLKQRKEKEQQQKQQQLRLEISDREAYGLVRVDANKQL